MSIETLKDQEWFQAMAENIKYLKLYNRQKAIEYIEKLVVDQEYQEYYAEDCAE